MSTTPPSFPQEQPQSYGRVPNHLAWAIVVTIIAFCACCVVGAIPGIVAIVFATQVNSKLAAGDRVGAEQASKNAKLWSWITTGLVVVGLLLNIISYATGGSEKYRQMLEQLEQQSAQKSSNASDDATDASAAAPTEQQAAAVAVDARTLHAAYSANEVAADQQYKGKLLQVSGSIEAIDSGIGDEPVVRLSAGDFDSVHLKGLPSTIAASLQKGQQITVTCTGDGEVMGSPMLDDCSIQ
jgi:hypothetical protein